MRYLYVILMATYQCMLGHEHKFCNDDNENSDESMRLFRMAKEAKDLGDITSELHNYHKSMLLGNKGSYNNFFLKYRGICNPKCNFHLIGVDDNDNPIYLDYEELQQKFDFEKYFLEHEPDKYTEEILTCTYLDNPILFHKIFTHNDKINAIYQKYIDNSRIKSFVDADINDNFKYITMKYQPI